MKRFALLLLLTGLAHAQMSSGSLVGDVTDQDAKPLAGVQIRAVESNTGFSRTATTAGNGSYVLEDLRPGVYSVTAYKQAAAKPKAEVLIMVVPEIARLV